MKFDQIERQLTPEQQAQITPKIEHVSDVAETEYKLWNTIQSVRDAAEMLNAVDHDKPIIVDAAGDVWTIKKYNVMGRGLEFYNLVDPVQIGLRAKAIRGKMREKGLPMSANDAVYDDLKKAA